MALMMLQRYFDAITVYIYFDDALARTRASLLSLNRFVLVTHCVEYFFLMLLSFVSSAGYF